MKIEASNNIATIRKAKGLTQQQVAELTGSHWITISKLERGVIRLTEDWMRRLATALEVNEVDLVLWTNKTLYRTHVRGRVFDDGHIEEFDANGPTVILHSDFFLRPWYYWYEAAGDALWPWFQDGDLVCVMDMEGAGNIGEYIGKLALVWSGGQAHIGRIEKTESQGVYDLFGGGRPPIRNIVPENFAPVVMAVMNVPIDAPQSREDERLYGKVARQI